MTTTNTSLNHRTTSCKKRLNLGCTEPCKWEIIVLRGKKKSKSKKEKFFENARFISGLANSYFTFDVEVTRT